MCTLLTVLTCTNFNLVLVLFPHYHMFIHYNENAVISILPSLVGIYMYTLFIFACTNLLGPSLFPPYHMFINDDKSTTKTYFTQQMPMSYKKSKTHDRPSLPQEGLVSNEHSTFPEIPVSHDATTYMDHLPLYRKNQHWSHHSLTGYDRDDVSVPSQYLYSSSNEYKNKDDEGNTGYTWPHESPGKWKEVTKMRCNLL